MSQRTNKFIMFFSLFLVAFFYHYFKYKFPEQNTVVAQIDKTKISYSQLKNFAKESGYTLNKDNRKFLLDQYINHQVILRYSEESGIRKKDLEDQFKNEKEATKKRIIIENYFDIMAKNDLTVSNEDIKKYYQTHRLLQLRMVTFSKDDSLSLNKIGDFYKKLNRGDDFKDVYLSYFPEAKSSKAGLIGIIDVYDIPLKIRSLILALKNRGDFTKPIDIGEYYAIYYLEKNPSFGQSKNLLVQKTKEEKILIFQDKLKGLIRNSIQYNEQYIKAIYENNIDLNSRENQFKIIAACSFSHSRLTIIAFLLELKEQHNITDMSSISLDDLRKNLEEIFMNHVILDLAKNNDLNKNKDFLKILNKEYTILERKQAQDTITYIIEKFYNEEKNSITEEDLLTSFKKNYGQYHKSDLIQLQQIIFKDKATAEEVNNTLKKNKQLDFEILVTRYSTDPYAKKYMGITAYTFAEKLSEIYPNIEKMKVGDILPLRLEDGHYILEKIYAIQPGARVQIESVQEDLINKILIERLNLWVDSLVKKYNIKIKKNYKNLEVGDRHRKWSILRWYRSN